MMSYGCGQEYVPGQPLVDCYSKEYEVGRLAGAVENGQGVVVTPLRAPKQGFF